MLLLSRPRRACNAILTRLAIGLEDDSRLWHADLEVASLAGTLALLVIHWDDAGFAGAELSEVLRTPVHASPAGGISSLLCGLSSSSFGYMRAATAESWPYLGETSVKRTYSMRPATLPCAEAQPAQVQVSTPPYTSYAHAEQAVSVF